MVFSYSHFGKKISQRKFSKKTKNIVVHVKYARAWGRTQS